MIWVVRCRALLRQLFSCWRLSHQCCWGVVRWHFGAFFVDFRPQKINFFSWFCWFLGLGLSRTNKNDFLSWFCWFLDLFGWFWGPSRTKKSTFWVDRQILVILLNFSSLSLSLSLLYFYFSLPSCFSFLFLVLVFSFCFVCFLVQNVILLFFLCLLSCFLNHHVWFLLFCILFSCCCCFLFSSLWCFVFLIFGYLSKTSLNDLEIAKKNKNEKCRKKGTLGQEQLAQVCSQIVSFFFFVFL